MTLSTLTLTFRQIAARQVIPHGLHDVEADLGYLSNAAEYLAATITAKLMTEPGGLKVRNEATYIEHRCPWWLPGFLWKRVPKDVRTVVAEAEPLWTYPSASLRFPKLGKPQVMLAVHDGYEMSNEWR